MERWREVAARQFGAIGRSQLVALGHTDDAIWRLLRQGELEDALPGVYRINGAPRSWLQDLRIATLWAGEGAAVSHRSAAALWGLQGFPEGPITISTPKKNQVSSVRFKVYRIPLG